MRSASLHTVWLFALLVSCSGDQSLRIHAQAAHATHITLSRFQHVIRTARVEQQDIAVRRSETRSEARRRVAAIRLAWAPVVSGYNALAESHDVWVASLLAAAYDEAPPTGVWVRLAGEVIHLWAAVQALSEDLGVDIPARPPLLLRLTGAP